MGEDDKIVKTVEAVEGLVKAVPVYQDGLQPAVRQIGRALETLTKTIHIVLAPIAALVWGYDKICELLQQRLTEKLSNVPLDRIKTPDITIAGPVIEALRFASKEETLRELYANLLATSMDSETAKNAHPGFVQIIKNMSPDEARIMKFLIAKESQPLIDIFKKNKLTHSWVPLYRNFSFLGKNSKCEFIELVPNYLNNLCRLGLTEIPPRVSLSITEIQKKDSLELNIYDELKKDKEVVEFIQEIDLEEGFIIDFENKVIDLTDFGRQFCSACVIDKNLPQN